LVECVPSVCRLVERASRRSVERVAVDQAVASVGRAHCVGRSACNGSGGSMDRPTHPRNGLIDLIDPHIDTPTDTPAGLRTGGCRHHPPPPPDSKHLHMCVFCRLVDRIASVGRVRRSVDRRSSERVGRSSVCRLVERASRRSVERVASVKRAVASVGRARCVGRFGFNGSTSMNPPTHPMDQST
jgi:hypothetical protein